MRSLEQELNRRKLDARGVGASFYGFLPEGKLVGKMCELSLDEAIDVALDTVENTKSLHNLATSYHRRKTRTWWTDHNIVLAETPEPKTGGFRYKTFDTVAIIYRPEINLSDPDCRTDDNVLCKLWFPNSACLRHVADQVMYSELQSA